MQKVSKWAMYAGLGAIALTGLAGCNKGDDSSADNSVSPSIQSPVMNKADDKSLAGSDAGTGSSTSNSTASTSNSAMSNGATTAKKNGAAGGAGSKMSGAGSKSSVPAPNTKKQ